MRDMYYYLNKKEHIWFEYDENGLMYDLWGCPTWFSDFLEEENSRIRKNRSYFDGYKKLREVRGY